jgi:glutamate-1-semialdehyde 2,1-aminomutase
MMEYLLYALAALAAFWLIRKLVVRLQLSRAKHPSLRGHAKMARRVAKFVPFYEYADDEFFACDGAPAEVVQRRRQAFDGISRRLREKAPKTLAASDELEHGISDVRFVNHYRVPFQFRNRVRRELPLGCVVAETDNRRVRDLDGNWSVDVTGAYGANLFGYDFYKGCIDRGVERARELGPVLGPYHPVIADNVRRLARISGLDEVSFHMSGTEAVMQAVRLARYHTRRSHVVRFCGAYHGWWDGVQAGVGNPRPAHEIYTLNDMSQQTLAVLRTRKDIACVLINPLQALHPNGNAPSDSMLVTGERTASYDKAAYTAWLSELREVCSLRGIVLIFDEVFLGFRLAVGGAQEYFGVKADLVTYGKTLGGGLPVGVVCGKRELMRRFRDDSPTDICFARGTFNSHPYVMTAMNEFLLQLERPEILATYEGIDARWDGRARLLDRRCAEAGLPLQVANMVSIFTTLFTQPSRYSWMFQYYLRLEGVAPSWIGTGRFIFTHDLSDDEFADFCDRFVRAGEAMMADGWWWSSAELTAKSIKKQVMREMLAAAFQGKRKAQPAPLRPSPGGPEPEPAPAMQVGERAAS